MTTKEKSEPAARSDNSWARRALKREMVLPLKRKARRRQRRQYQQMREAERYGAS